ncbi:MAG: hypothetical protein J6Y80_07425, partial [Victivallales bacterium]|nr:hypothetical protein [Victivallales bacterium]
MSELFLGSKREASLLRRHPWVFSGAVSRVVGKPAAGETVDIRAANGRWLARAAYSPNSQIRARIWTFQEDEAVDAQFFARRIQAAVEYRERLGFHGTDAACRLIHGEA